MRMRSFGLAPLLSLLLAAACAEGPGSPVGPDGDCDVPSLSDAPAPASALNLFAYDRAAAYDLQLVPLSTQSGVRIYALSFLSPRGTGRATGRLFVPDTGTGPFAGIIVQHGLPGTSEVMVDFAILEARHGAVVVAIDAPFARRAGTAISFTEADSAEQVQLMTDLQRAVDVLRARPDVDPNRIAYVGFSYGGAMGALFVGIEHRLRTAILAVADGGLVTHVTADGVLPQLPCAQRRRWLESMIPIEPIKYVGFASPTPILLQSGRQDELVSMADAERLHAAVRDPKTIRWYDAGHGLNIEAARDRQLWLQQWLGMAAPTF